MQMKDRTRIMFADTLEEMLQTMTLDKVRVAKLCERCGATTPTFYYYFHDKYELVAWMFLQDFAGEFGDQEPSYTAEGLISLAQRMEKRKKFYQKAFLDSTQNSIADYIEVFNLHIASEAIKKKNGVCELTQDQLLAVKYHNYGIMGIFREWLFSDNLTVEQMNTFLFERTPDFLKAAFAEYSYSTDDLLQRAGKPTKKTNKS